MAILRKSKANEPSDLTAIEEVKSWKDFKEYVLRLDPYRNAFRGQASNIWRLRTAFHRTGRASLVRCVVHDVPALHRHLSGLTTHQFNLQDALDYAAFLNLVQHHGYPTPMLDWTQSPFVAAYIAYRDLKQNSILSDQRIRIIMFDARLWNSSYERAAVLMPGYLHLTILEPLATNNPRVIPQQSISTVTNVDDIETYVREKEKDDGRSFLRVIDLPANERRIVMQDLALIDITAGSLFPGLDGACLQLKERYFDL